MHGCCAHEARHDSVGKSRYEIGFEGKSGNTHQQRRQHPWTRSIATHTDYHIRSKFREYLAATDYTAGNVRKSSGTTSKADALKLPDLYQTQVETCLRNKPRLDSAIRADEDYFRRVELAKLARNRQRRNDMTARAAAYDRRPHRLVCLLTDVQQHTHAGQSYEQ